MTVHLPVGNHCDSLQINLNARSIRANAHDMHSSMTNSLSNDRGGDKDDGAHGFRYLRTQLQHVRDGSAVCPMGRNVSAVELVSSRATRRVAAFCPCRSPRVIFLVAPRYEDPRMAGGVETVRCSGSSAEESREGPPPSNLTLELAVTLPDTPCDTLASLRLGVHPLLAGAFPNGRTLYRRPGKARSRVDLRGARESSRVVRCGTSATGQPRRANFSSALISTKFAWRDAFVDG